MTVIKAQPERSEGGERGWSEAEAREASVGGFKIPGKHDI